MDLVKTRFLDVHNNIKSNPTEELFEQLLILFRELRKECATKAESRKILFYSVIELKFMKEVLESLLHLSDSNNEVSLKNILSNKSSHNKSVKFSETAFQCLKVGLQVIGNTIVLNDLHCVKHIWDYIKDFLLSCYEVEYCDKTLSNILMMILYNVYKFLPKITEDSKVLSIIISQAKVNNEFALFFLDDFLFPKEGSGTEFKTFFASLEHHQRPIVLEYAKANIKAGLDVKCFMELFNEDIFKMLKDEPYHDHEIETSVINLELLTELSTSPMYQNKLQSDGTFVSNVFEFLKTMHFLGKQGKNKNMFAPDPNLSHMFDSEISSNEPSYGLKSTCVNLVGNLCYFHRANQDYARTSDLLPVLLECCNLDAKNPLLKEYSVFAIANCCKNNIPNQEYIANMNKKGDYTFDSATGINLVPGVNIGTLKKEEESSTWRKGV